MTTTKYRWAEGIGTRIKVNAQVAGERLEFIRKKHGALTPKLVLDDARSSRSPLHAAFLWKDKSAAEAFRLQQASYLLRSIEVVVVIEKRKPPQPIRAFLNVKQDGMKSYAPVAKVMGDEDLRNQVLGQAFDELKDWRERYRRLNEFARVFAAIDGVRLSPLKRVA